MNYKEFNKQERHCKATKCNCGTCPGYNSHNSFSLCADYFRGRSRRDKYTIIAELMI
jgi:hypothetical protein